MQFQNNLMKFILLFQKTALYIAVEKENIEIIKLLLSNNRINININNILSLIFFIEF